ncbi:hypothetical protein Poli38472_010881 [Pythium oligandrum]|uniref:Adhesin domain-containing protein n=1 Tax=Pythium oligandrum TaxID=41045 RepID=A0A8K1CF10_PYTOL|nr:hypothetical protein Poli38472_010881 [Pythium oligandrum]|eukprot:TMW61818.1 hypothetical protein Poli38472_010881 [Pythium oligandrum]
MLGRLRPVAKPFMTRPHLSRGWHSSRHQARGLRVHRSAITTPKDPIHSRQLVEQTWTISGGVFHPRHPRHRVHQPSGIEKLKIKTPGLTVISVRPEHLAATTENLLAQVRVSSNAKEIVESLQVASRQPHCLALDFQAPPYLHGSYYGAPIRGNLLTEITLAHPQQLRSLSVAGGGDVVVLDDVLVSEATAEYAGYRQSSLELAAFGDSRLFIDTVNSEMQLRDLNVGVVGDGRVYMSFPSLSVTRRADLGVGGNGSLDMIVGRLETPMLNTRVMGDGCVALEASQPIQGSVVNARVLGSGLIHVQAPEAKIPKVAEGATPPTRQVFHQDISITGAGSVNLSDVPTHSAKIRLVKGSHVSVQVTDRLELRAMGSSSVECVNGVPAYADVRGIPPPSLLETDRSVKQAAEQAATSAKPSVPTAESAFTQDTALPITTSSWGNHWGSHWGSQWGHGWGHGYGQGDWRGDYERCHRRRGRWIVPVLVAGSVFVWYRHHTCHCENHRQGGHHGHCHRRHHYAHQTETEASQTK